MDRAFVATVEEVRDIRPAGELGAADLAPGRGRRRQLIERARLAAPLDHPDVRIRPLVELRLERVKVRQCIAVGSSRRSDV